MEAGDATTTNTNTLGSVQTIVQILAPVIFLVMASVALGIIGFVGVWLYSRIKTRQLIKKILANPNSQTIFQIKIRSNGEQKQEATADFLRSIHRILPNNTHFSLEMSSQNQFLSYYLTIPSIHKEAVSSQLYAQYPDSEIEEIKEYLPEFHPSTTAISSMRFKKNSINPLNTYQTLNEDLLKNLSSILSKLGPEEQVFIQFALQRVGGKWWERSFSVGFFKLFGQKEAGEDKLAPPQLKLSQDLYLGELRIAYVAKDRTIAQSKLATLCNLLKIMKSPYNEPKRERLTISAEVLNALRARVALNQDLWTVAEIATIFHFPYSGSLVANVVNTTSKRAPAPDILPTPANTPDDQLILFGETNFRNDYKKFGIKRIDRRRHLYVVGKTGSGKSRLIELLILSDIQQGRGCCLLDPHGDLATEILKFIPEERLGDVVYIDPTDRDFPIGFNPLEPVQDYQMRQHLSTFFIAIFKKLFTATWNPRMEHLIRYITLALLETPDSNIMGIPRILSDTNFRQRVIRQIQDPVVKSFWTNEFAAFNERYANDAIIPIQNKVSQFIANPTVRNMVGQPRNMLDFEKFMNEGKIVLINVSKGKIGDENAALLGSMFITKIQQAALARAKTEEENRKDFYFYVDEFQNFATDAFSSILSEARKYHLNLTIAHQYIAQLPEEVKATAFGNVGTIISFAVGGDDAQTLAREFAPTFTPEDIINLNTREMYIKMSIDGKLCPPFSARTLPVPNPTLDLSTEVINQSRMKFGKNRAAVENEIARWSSATESVAGNASSDFPEPII